MKLIRARLNPDQLETIKNVLSVVCIGITLWCFWAIMVMAR
jgi:hypothetical protein